MWAWKRLGTGLTVSIVLATMVVSSLSTVAANDHPAPDPIVVAAFDDLEAYVAGLQSQLGKGTTNSLLGKLDRAESKYKDGQVCVSANELGAFGNQAQGSRKGERASLYEDLFNRARSLESSMFDVFVHDPNLIPPGPCFDPQDHASPSVDIVASDATVFSATVSWPQLDLITTTEAGETWSQASLPGVDNPLGAPGAPGIPSWQEIVAVPRGATAQLSFPEPPTVVETLSLNLFPFQDGAPDQGRQDPFGDPPFVVDRTTYSTDAFFPPDPCAFMLLGEARDLLLGQIQCNAGQYNPVTDEFRAFDATTFTLTFETSDGSAPAFITSQSLTGFEPASELTLASPINSDVVGKYVHLKDILKATCWGEELLILTHPSFRAAADDLAAWKQEKGIATSVFEVGGGRSTLVTGPQIDAFIEQRYHDCVVRPSYVDIIGDSEWVPPARTNHNTLIDCPGCGDSTTGSDWYYSTMSGAYQDVLPSFAVGRISVDTPEEAQTIVDKIIQYESDPPFINIGAGGPFYTSSTVASFFQCCRADVGETGWDKRTFIRTSETARDHLLSLGYDVDRIYTKASGTPKKYFSGALLPADIGAGSGFAWDGNTADILAALNEGRFLMMHRGHGSSDGWADPSFSIADIASATNGEKLPVIFSVNCSSGFWDQETDSGGTTESFMEEMLLKSGGGMVSGIGDDRDSNSWLNSALARGMYDAAFPDLVPFGGSEPETRLGDIMNHGRLYLFSQIGVAQPAGGISLEEVKAHNVLYHVFGDATLEMWTQNPHRFRLPLDYEVFVEPGFLELEYAVEGAEITAFTRAEGSYVPFGRAIVEGGVARITPISSSSEPPSTESLVLSASVLNARSILLTPQPVGAPDLIVESVYLSGGNVVAPGEDLSERLLLRIGNVGSAMAPGTIRADGTINNDGYMLDLVLSRDVDVPAGLRPLPLPAGEAFAEDGLLDGGRVSRTPDLAAGDYIVLPAPDPVNSDVGGTVPTQAPETKMFLCASIDSPLNVAESDETNNVNCLEVVVASPVRG
jgi:hypothetical protein